MDDAQVPLGLGGHGLEGLRESLQPIHTSDEDVLHALVLQFGYDRQPELGPFVLNCV